MVNDPCGVRMLSESKWPVQVARFDCEDDLDRIGSSFPIED